MLFFFRNTAWTIRMTRPSNRDVTELRTVNFEPNVAPHADGSVLVSFGNTRVICAASIEDSVPRWMKAQKISGGWLSAEYSMLPYSTLDRKSRDISRGKLDGRSSEIQRLIGRSLRAVVDLSLIGSRTIWVDCDVIQADGGTRTASITGACVAVAIALAKLRNAGKINANPIKSMIAAVSAGIYQNEAVLDLDYLEDKDADVDFNVVMTETGQFVEIQGSGEEATFSPDQMASMIALASKGIQELIIKQKEAIESVNQPSPQEMKKLASLFE